MIQPGKHHSTRDECRVHSHRYIWTEGRTKGFGTSLGEIWQLDISVQNSGIYPYQWIEQTSPEKWGPCAWHKSARCFQCRALCPPRHEAPSPRLHAVYLVDHRPLCDQCRIWAWRGQQIRHQRIHQGCGTGVLRLARAPTRWNHLVEKNVRKINFLSMILSQKWFPRLCIKPYGMIVNGVEPGSILTEAIQTHFDAV